MFFYALHEKEKRLTIEDTHTRETFLLRNDLKLRLEELSKKHKRGFKTELINYSLEKVLEELTQGDQQRR